MSDADEKLRQHLQGAEVVIEAARRHLATKHPVAARRSEVWPHESQLILTAEGVLAAFTTEVIPSLLDRLAAVEAERDASEAAQELMAAQFRIMQREKEHGWQEADKHEARADAALAERDQARQALQRVKAMRDRWNEVTWDFEDAPACVGQQYELFSELSSAIAGPEVDS
jgi:hypothetical protein